MKRTIQINDELKLSNLSGNTTYQYEVLYNDEIIGYVTFDFNKKIFNLHEIFIVNKFRRKNIASLIIQTLCNILSKGKIFSIIVEPIDETNPVSLENLIKFYESNGFIKVSTRIKNFYYMERKC